MNPSHPFRLSRWFAGLALVTVASIAITCALLLSWFVTQRMLLQEGTLTRDFVQSLVAGDEPVLAIFGPTTEATRRAALMDANDTLEHLTRIPDMLRLNIYDQQRTVVWSTNVAMRGRQFGPNHDLDLALQGQVVVETKTDQQRKAGKEEYVALVQPAELFVEIYVPVKDAQGRVVGAIEFYKNPRALMQSLHQLRWYIALGAIGFGSLLFAVLFGLIRRADNHMRAQERKLVDAETFAAIGEMSSVIAHGIRNPLAAIRSSAELIQLDCSTQRAPHGAHTAEAAQDIVTQADRLSDWLRELLTWMRPVEQRAQAFALAPLAESCLQDHAREFERRRVQARADVPHALPPVHGDAVAVGQVMRSLVGNALDALTDGGRIVIDARLVNDGQFIRLAVCDNGSGISDAHRGRVGKPFFTTKAHGMGVGLALARRLIERHGGHFEIDGAPDRGTTAAITLRVAPKV